MGAVVPADTTALRAHADLLPAWTDTEHVVVGGLGYEGENTAITTRSRSVAARP
jgi:hypothetical protein